MTGRIVSVFRSAFVEIVALRSSEFILPHENRADRRKGLHAATGWVSTALVSPGTYPSCAVVLCADSAASFSRFLPVRRDGAAGMTKGTRAGYPLPVHVASEPGFLTWRNA